MKYSKSYQSGHNEPVLLASSGAKPNIAKPNIAKPKKQKNTPYGNKKEEFRRENFDESCMLAEMDCFEGGDQEMCHFLETECGGGMPPPLRATGPAPTPLRATGPPPLPPWLVGIQDPDEACRSANNYCNNGNKKACKWLDIACSSRDDTVAALVTAGVKDVTRPPWLPTLGGLCTDLNYNCRLLANGAKDKEPYAPAIKGCREYATRCPNVFHTLVAVPSEPNWKQMNSVTCEEIQKKCVTGDDKMCKQYSMHCARVPISPAPVAFASDSPLVIKPTLTHDRHCHTLNTTCKYEDPDNLACREYAKLCPNVYPPHTESMVGMVTWGRYDRGTCESFQKACVTGVGTKSSEDCQRYSRHCANVPITATHPTHPTAATATCEIEKSEIKNLHRTVSEVRSECDVHTRHLDEMLVKEFAKGAAHRRAAQEQAEVHRAELDAAKAMIGAPIAAAATSATYEVEISSVELVSPLINSLGPDPIATEEEENDPVRKLRAGLFFTNTTGPGAVNINSVGQFVDHVWKGIGWDFDSNGAQINEIARADVKQSANTVFGVKFSHVDISKTENPVFTMTESNIRLFRRKFAKRLYYVYYSFVLMDVSEVLHQCPELAMYGWPEMASDTNFMEKLKTFCGNEAGGFMERELGHYITILGNIRSEINKYGGVVPPGQLINQLKGLRSKFNDIMKRMEDKGFNYGKVTDDSDDEAEDIEVGRYAEFNIPTEDEERPLNKFETMVLSGKNRPPGIPDDIYKAAIQISFMSKQVCLNTESTKNSINRKQGSAEPSSKHSARAVFNCRFRRMDVFFDTVNKMIDANAADRATVMDALASKADREENLAETNLWPGWRELSTQHFNEVRNRRAQMDMDLYVMWVTRENSKPFPPSNPTEEEIEEYNSTPTMSEAELEQIRYNMARDYSMEAIPGIDYKTMVNLLVTFNRWDFDARQRPSETQGISARGVGRGIGAPAKGTGGPAESVVRKDIVMPPDTDVETFTVMAKEVILTIVRDETMPDWVYETIPAEIREELNSEHGLSLNTAKWSEIFHAMEPTNPEGLLSRGDPRNVSLIIWQRKQIMTIVSYVLRHLKNNEEWIISTMGELMAGNYKSNEYVSLAVEFFTLLGKSVGLEQNSDPNLGTLGARLTTLTADNLTLNETITDLEASLAAKTCAVDTEDAGVAEIVDEAATEITTLDSTTKQLTTQKNELETKLKKAEEDLAMRKKLIIGLAVFIIILIIVLLIK